MSAQFKVFLRDAGCAHSKARVRHPQSNGTIERWHKSIATECVRRTALGDLDETRAVVAVYVLTYNTVRLHSAINLEKAVAAHLRRCVKLDMALPFHRALFRKRVRLASAPHLRFQTTILVRRGEAKDTDRISAVVQ